MNFKIGDFVLIKRPCYGLSNETDLGPWIVRVTHLRLEGICYKHYLEFKSTQKSSASGDALYSDIIAKVHSRDIEALFKDEIQNE